MLNSAITVKPLDFLWNGMGIAPGTPAEDQSAKTFYQKELRDARFVNDRNSMIRFMSSLAPVLIRLNQLKEARLYAVKSLELAETLHDYAAMGCAHNLLGDVAFAQGQMDDANLFYHRGWAAYAKIGEKKGEAWSYARIGGASRELGDFDGALRFHGKSAELMESLDEPLASAWNKNLTGMVYACVGRYSEALQMYQRTLELYQARQNVQGQDWTLELTGNLRLAAGNDQEAEKLYRQARALFSDQGSDPRGAAWHHYHLGAVYLSRKNNEDGKDEFQKALSLFEELGDGLGRGAALTNLAEIACLQQNYKEAQEILREGLKLGLTGPAHSLLPDMLANVVQLLKSQGEDKKAVSLVMMLLSFPSCSRQTKDRGVYLAAELGARVRLAPDDKLFHWVKDLDLAEIAENWLASLGKKTALKKSQRLKPKKVSFRGSGKNN